MLDDDDDMAEMYLTDKLEEQLEASSISSVVQDGHLDEADMDDGYVIHSSLYINSNVTWRFSCSVPFQDIHRNFGGHCESLH